MTFLPHIQGVRFITFCFLSFLFETPIILNFIIGQNAWSDILSRRLLLFHLISGLVWLFYEPFTFRRFFSIERYWSRLFAFFVLCFPVFGIVLVIGIYISSRFDLNLGREDEEILPDTTEKEQYYKPLAYSAQKERVLSELDFIPLAEIMEGSDVNLKRGAIERLTTLKTPEAIKILFKYRSDPSAEVRFYVTSSLVHIKADFDEQLDSAKKQMQRDIDKMSARTFLARIYMNYADSGLLDEVTGSNYLKEAVYHLQTVIDSDFDSQEAYELLMDFYLKEESWPEFDNLVGVYQKKKGPLNEPILIKQILANYRRNQFAGVQAGLRDLCAKEKCDKNWAALKVWWGVV